MGYDMSTYRAILVLVLALLINSNSFAADLIVNIYKPICDGGTIQIALHTSEDSIAHFDDRFTKNYNAYKTEFISVTADGKLTYLFKDIPEGIYAVSAFHDLNDDGVLNRQLFPYSGIPIESYGFSKNHFTAINTPSFEQSAVAVYGKTTEVTILLNHNHSVAAEKLQKRVALQQD